MIDGGELFVRALKKAGIAKIFTLHGVHVDPIFQACLDQGVGLIDTRHEAAAGHAAEGFARATRSPGVVVVTAGPGFTNVLTSTANAYLDRIPVLYVAGAPPVAEAGTNPFQGGFDQVAMMAPVTKFAHRITAAEQIPDFVARALQTAISGPPGPVFLEIPMDLMFGKIAADDVRYQCPTPSAGPPPSVEAVARSIDLLRTAERPVIMAGGGVWYADAGAELARFAERSGIPVFTNARGHGVMTGDHPLFGGWFPNLAGLADDDGKRVDAVLLIGARTGVFTGGGSDAIIPGDAKFIHIDVDSAEHGRNRQPDVAMTANARAALRALNDAAGDQDWPDRSAWQGTIRARAAAHRQTFAPALERSEPPIHPYQAIHTVLEALDDDAIICADGAEAFHWLELMARMKQPGSFLAPGYLGCLGTGLPYAIGAKVAHPGRQVVVIVGDGSVGLNIAEFDTMVRHDLAITTVVINNQSWGASVHGQEAFYGNNRLVVSELGEVAYHQVAAGFGCHAEFVERIEELTPALRRALTSGRPACLNVMVDRDAVPPDVEALIGVMKARLIGG